MAVRGLGTSGSACRSSPPTSATATRPTRWLWSRRRASLLAEYHDATYEQTIEFVRGLTDADMDKIVDRRWDPPVTMGVRLVSVLADDLEHAGQAAFIRGLIERGA